MLYEVITMHKSQELHEVIAVVFNQLKLLGVNADVTYIFKNIENTKDFYLWLATENRNNFV